MDGGGDAPCWAHLFDDDIGETHRTQTGDTSATGSGVADLPAIAASLAVSGTAWTLSSDDLNATLLVLNAGGRSSEYVNESLEVLVIGVLGTGIVVIDGHRHDLRPGQAILVPKGSARSFRARAETFAYLSCHQKRGGLWPALDRRQFKGNETPPSE